MNLGLKSRNEQSGFSLAGATVGLSLVALVAALSASVLISSKKTEVQADFLFELQREQAINLYRSRSLLFLKEQLALMTRDQNGNLVNNPAMADLASCFAGRPPSGGSCAQYQDPLTGPGLRIRFVNGVQQGVGTPTTNCTGYRCNMSSTIEIWRNCDANRCGSIRVSARTEITDSSFMNLKRTSSGQSGRESIGEIPGIVFAERNSINFDCGAAGFLTGVNYTNMTGQCSGLVGNRECSDMRPLNAFGQGALPNDPNFCKPMQTGSCMGNQYGFSQLGLFGNESCLN